MRPKFPEYYQVNLDRFGKYPFSCGEKIDGFTMKTIKSSKSALNLLTDHEKRIFLSKLNDYQDLLILNFIFIIIF